MNVPADPSRRILDRVTVARRRAEQLATFLSQAERAAEVGDVDAAIAACEEVLVLDPDNEAAARLVERVKETHDRRQPGRANRAGASSDQVLRDDSTGVDRQPPAPHDFASDAHQSEFLTELADAGAAVRAEASPDSMPAPGFAAPTYTPPFLSPAIPEPSVALDLFSSESDLHAPSEIVRAVDAAAVPLANLLDDFRLAPAGPEGGDLVMASPRSAPPLAQTGGMLARPMPAAVPPMARPSPTLGFARRLPSGVRRPSVWSFARATGAALLLVLAIGSVWALWRLPRTSVAARATTSRQDVRAPTPGADVAMATPTLPRPATTSSEPPRADRESEPRVAPVVSPTLEAPRVTAARDVGSSEARVPAAVATVGTFEPSVPTRSPGSPQPEPSGVLIEPASAAVPPGAASPSPITLTPATIVTAEPPARALGAPPMVVASVPSSPIVSAALRVDDSSALSVDDRADARERASVAGRESPAATVPEVVAAPVPTGLDDERAVRDAVRAYTSAYSGLDVEAVKAVFPGVNDTALRRAFRSLRSQQVELRGTAVSVSGDAALVSGTWVSSAIGQVGGSAPQRDERPVVFMLAKRNGAWVILSRR